MKLDWDSAEKNTGVALGAVSIVAIGGLIYNGSSGVVDYLNAIINFTQVAIPVLALLLTGKLWEKSVPYSKIGFDVLQGIAKRHNDLKEKRFKLLGPKYDQEGYDPDKQGGGARQYLFLQSIDGKKRPALIPVQDINQGVLAFTMRKMTMQVLLGDEVQNWDVAAKKVAASIIERIKAGPLKGYGEDWYVAEIKESGRMKKTKDSEQPVREITAITAHIDLDESKFDTVLLRKRRFGKLVRLCTEAALDVLKSTV